MGIVQIGFSNVAIGGKALRNNIGGHHMVAIGDSAMYNQNESFGFNTAVGSKAMFGSVGGAYNTAVGAEALFHMGNTIQNVAVGVRAPYSNTIGFANTALGTNALYSNVNGTDNTATGFQALYLNIGGVENTAMGQRSLRDNNEGRYNTALGARSLGRNQIGYSNTALGYSSLLNNIYGSGNTCVGSGSDVTTDNLSNASAFGAGASVNASNKVVVGNTNVTVIGGAVNWSVLSDGRFKTDINENVEGLNFIMKLRPVTYRLQIQNYERSLGKDEASFQSKLSSYQNAESMVRSGFIAQEVEKAADELGYNFSGLHKPENEKDNYTLSYSDFVVPIIKAMQEQQKLIEVLKKQNEDLMKRLETIETNLSKRQ